MKAFARGNVSAVNFLQDSFAEQLRIEGINFKGYGIIPYFVMHDPDLTMDAKAIYLYLSSFSGNGNIAFPTRDKILSDLKMSKDAYYRHFRLLMNEGYIEVKQTMAKRSRFARNIYTLISNPKKLQSKDNLIKETGYIRYTGLKAFGYGFIPKAVMTDPRLMSKSMCIYGYFASLTGAGNKSFPPLKRILYDLQISTKSYYKYLNQLLELNYIKIEQRKSNGRMSINDYYLIDVPNWMAGKSSIGKNKDTVATELLVGKNEDTVATELPIGKNKYTVATKLPIGKNEDTQKQDAQKQDTNNNSFKSTNIKSINNISPSLPLSFRDGNFNLSYEGASEPTDVTKKVRKEILSKKELPCDYRSDERLMTEAIHFMTRWEEKYPIGFYDHLHQYIYNLFNEALIQMCLADYMQLKGNSITCEKVISKLNQWLQCEQTGIQDSTSELVDAAMDNYYNAVIMKEVKNPLKYMEACIWDLLLTGNINMYSSLKREEGILTNLTVR